MIQTMVVVLALLIGLAIGFMKGLNLPEETRRGTRKALFEIKELPRRFFI
jgi:hypothetical protein